MHEMSLAMGVVKEVERQLEPYGADARATRVQLTVGKMHAVVPEAMRLCFQVASRGTRAADAELEIEEIPVVGRCPTCDEEWRLEQVHFLCPRCEGPVGVIEGEELLLSSIEFETPDPEGETR